jgi:hypothetical protein
MDGVVLASMMQINIIIRFFGSSTKYIKELTRDKMRYRPVIGVCGD